MDRKKLGFTMIEVALFLAITGALFVGIAVGTQNSIFQQRYNDAVQNFAEFLRSAYSQTMNIQSEGTGKSEQAIYGKLVSFGETEDLAGNAITNTTSVYSYNVIGEIGDGQTGKALDMLESVGANVARKSEDGSYKAVGLVEDYRPRWASAIQNTENTESFKGALLIIRHPASGTVYTFVSDEVLDINKGIRQANQGAVANYNPLASVLSSFEMRAVDFCVNPNGVNEGGLRRDIRIIEGARNGSGVEIIGDEASRCESQ